MKIPKATSLFFLLLCILISAFVLNVSLGSVYIPFSSTLSVLTGQLIEHESWKYIITEYRLPKAITAALVGSGLSLSGLLMQTLFRNPLAGPFVLGISSGASLGAALFIMGSGLLSTLLPIYLLNDTSLAIASSMGSFLVLFVVLIVARSIKDTMALLIIGLMFGSVTGAIVNLLSYTTTAEKLKRFIYWSLGSVGNLSWTQVSVLAILVLLGILCSVFLIKPLNSLLLGEAYAQSLGVKIKHKRYAIIGITGVLVGSITAFAGPIAFVGLAVPHMAKQLFQTTDHKVLLPVVVLLGAITLLLCDIIAQWPSNVQVLPINAITSVLGAPVVIWLLVKRKKLIF